jgi:membrane protein YdbS with pleckstrin-like domain/phage FluMu protein Com
MMITFPCDKCDKLLETDDSAAGTKVECPHCADINVVPSASRGGPSSHAKARPAAPDRAEALGLPPDRGPEQTVLRVHPAMVRAHPLAGAGLLLALAVGIVGTGVSMATALIPAAIAFGVLALFGVIWFIVWKIKSWTTTLIITTKRTTLRRGIFSRYQREVLHDRVQDVQVTQSFLDRMLGVGALGLSTSSDEGVEINVVDVPNVLHVRKVIDAYRDM